VYTGHYEFQTQSANVPMHNDSPSTLSENTMAGQSGSIDSLAEAVNCLAGSGDGINIIDFAQVRTMDLSSSPTCSQKHVRFASKSDHARSVHYESSSDDSTRSSTRSLLILANMIDPRRLHVAASLDPECVTMHQIARTKSYSFCLP
jgi:hypothetical protein